MANNTQTKKPVDGRSKEAREAKAAAKATEAAKSMKTENAPVEVTPEPTSVPEPNPATTYTAEDVQRIVAEALAKQAESVRPQVIQVMQNEKRVTVRFQAEVADDNVSYFGANNRYGPITGKSGMLYIPYSDWPQFLDERVRWMLKNRWLIVLDGLDEQERELVGVSYKPGEIMDEKAFAKMLDMSDEELREVFPNLCVSYREMVARRFLTAYKNGNANVRQRRALIKELNDISKKDYLDTPENDNRRKGAFAAILEGMNQEDI